MNDHILIIDIGNTNIVFAVVKNLKILNQWRCKTNHTESADTYKKDILNNLHDLGYEPNIIQNIIVSSVVSEVEDSLSKALYEICSIEPFFIDYKAVNIKLASTSPQNIGADRLLNAYYLIEQSICPGIVIDFGTATTFDIVSKDQVFLGGVICPGVNLTVQSLHNHTSKLPLIDIKKPADIIGNDSVAAMQSGIYWGYISMVEGLINRIKEFHQLDDCKIIATGGLAEFFVSELSDVSYVDINWTLKALIAFYEKKIEKE